VSLTLHLGVTVMPYSGAMSTAPKAPTSKRGRAAKARGYGKGMTTGDVAAILEARYGVMKTFVDIHMPDITKALEKSVAGAIKNAMVGAPTPVSITEQGMSTIQASFKNFLAQREMDFRVRGVPTAAALMGVSHRFKHPYARRASRPSFIDTGLYQSSFRAWVD
jgi:hypothetical protein